MNTRDNTSQRLRGLISAVYTPFHDDGSLNLPEIKPYVDFLLENNLQGLYICGSTGEGVNMSVQERMLVSEKFVQEVNGRIPCVIQIGSNALPDCLELARHARRVGADAISANAPSYFRIGDTDTLVQWLCQMAEAASELPFYYYHIPRFTGIDIDMTDFLSKMEERCPSFRGIKYTDLQGYAFLEGVKYNKEQFDMFWGCDEMLLTGLMLGATGGVGSTYAMAPALYQNIIRAWETKNFVEGRRLQLLSWKMVKAILKYSPVHPSGRLVMGFHGLNLGPCRLPYTALDPSVTSCLKNDLQAIGFFDWACEKNGNTSFSPISFDSIISSRATQEV